MNANNGRGQEKRRVEISVRGRVQGVAFRYYTRLQARSLGLTGWVRNNPDRSVSIMAEGSPEALEAFCLWTSRGPDHALVDHQEIQWGPATNKFEHFNITG